MKNFYPNTLLAFLLLALLAGGLPARATHILGAELTYSLDHANPLKIRAQLVLYTDISLTNADNPSATVFFGPNESVEVYRTRRTTLPDNKYKHLYFFDYVFPAAGTYTMTYREQNRAIGIVNVTDSQNQAFCIATQVVIDPQGVSNHESARFLTDPVHFVQLGQTVKHHIGAFDPEGDSLTFQLVPSRGAFNTPLNGYVLPDFIRLNAWTGELTYTNPSLAGQYAFAVQVTEYRNKKVIGHLVRDFTVMVVQPAASFAQTLKVTPGAGISITPQNRIFLSPNQVLSLRALLQDEQADSTRFQVYSDLFAKTDKLRVVKNFSSKEKELQISLEADPALQRRAPYLIVLRAVSRKRQEGQPWDIAYTREKGYWVYIGSDLVSGEIKPGPAHPDLRLFPNPAGEMLFVDLPHFRPGLFLQVYSAQGQLVWQQPLRSARTPLLRRHFAPGRYFYRVTPIRGYERPASSYSGQFIFR